MARDYLFGGDISNPYGIQSLFLSGVNKLINTYKINSKMKVPAIELVVSFVQFKDFE